MQRPKRRTKDKGTNNGVLVRHPPGGPPFQLVHALSCRPTQPSRRVSFPSGANRFLLEPDDLKHYVMRLSYAVSEIAWHRWFARNFPRASQSTASIWKRSNRHMESGTRMTSIALAPVDSSIRSAPLTYNINSAFEGMEMRGQSREIARRGAQHQIMILVTMRLARERMEATRDEGSPNNGVIMIEQGVWTTVTKEI